MAWCPECKMEYRDGYSECSDCNVELVVSLPKHNVGANVAKKEYEYSAPAFAVSVGERVEADELTAYLSSFDIPTRVRYRAAGGHMTVLMGNTYGVDIYVPEKLLDEAMVLIEQYQTASIIETDIEINEDYFAALEGDE